MNRAYIGVLSTPAYLIGILGVSECLKRVKSKYPFYVVITNQISLEIEKLLNEHGIYTIRRNSIQIPEIIKVKNSRGEFSHWTNTFDKLSIFELTQFDKIVYLDADLYIRKNIDELFQYHHMATTPNRKYGPNITPPPELISGLLVIEPEKGLLNKFSNILMSISDKRQSIGDQDILQEYYINWANMPELHLDLKYNAFFTYLDYYINHCNYSLEDISVFHFILTKKPWNFSVDTVDDYIKYLNNRIDILYDRYHTQDLLDCKNSGNKNRTIIAKEYLKLLDSCKL